MITACGKTTAGFKLTRQTAQKRDKTDVSLISHGTKILDNCDTRQIPTISGTDSKKSANKLGRRNEGPHKCVFCPQRPGDASNPPSSQCVSAGTYLLHVHLFVNIEAVAQKLSIHL